MTRDDLESCWYGDRLPPIHWRAAAYLYGELVRARRALYRAGVLRAHHPGCPVIVVGNVTAGGTGKTPLVIWLAETLQAMGWRPGIVSRGYGSRRPGRDVLLVDPDTDPGVAGDEPVLVARRTGLPVAVHPARENAARFLVQRRGVNVLITDDGLQHYALARDVEICVLDGERRLGNGRLLPAGPLREPASRLARVDHVVTNGEARAGEIEMRLEVGSARSLDGQRQRPLSEFAGRRVHAAAGIGNPGRFFGMLEDHGLVLTRHPFPDHHSYRPGELTFDDMLPLLLTEKDAVKIAVHAVRDAWYVPVQAVLPDAFRDMILQAVAAASGESVPAGMDS